jgi:hypothetical protein
MAWVAPPLITRLESTSPEPRKAFGARRDCLIAFITKVPLKHLSQHRFVRTGRG